MGKLESFDNKATRWEGLWWHPEINAFTSGAINLADIKKFKGAVRLYVRKNKFFNGGENNRPNYNFSLRDANSENSSLLEVEDIEDDVPRDSNGSRLYTEEEVYKVIHGMENEYGLSYGNNLISDYV